MSDVLTIANDLLACQSVTPEDGGCQKLIADYLAEMGFTIEDLPFGEVKNLWARKGKQSPLFVFAGHTDVVPPGPLEQWSSPPFVPTQTDGKLYGRGAADMKGGLAAMLAALKRFIADNPNHKGSIAFLLTSDEEGPAINGTKKVVETLEKRGEKIDWCIVGEPSSENQLGDQIRPGRRGSLSGKLRVKGIQGHVAYPHKADNPIHAIVPALSELSASKWDNGNKYFPPTSFQISNIHAGTNATNVIPGECIIDFNFRFSSEVTSELLRQKVVDVLDKYRVNYHIDWNESATPFMTSEGVLIDAIRSAIKNVVGVETRLSTAGGTSDARFIAPTGAEVVELGPINATIHQINEYVSIEDLVQLEEIYFQVLQRLCG